MEKISVRTDLALESLEMASADSGLVEYQINEEGFKVSKIDIDDKLGEEIGKNKGTYYTIETNAIERPDHESLLRIQKEIARIVKEYLEKYQIGEDKLCMVVGLGNDSITPDALGPEVVKDVFVTKHIFDLHPEEINEGFRPVCAIAPGVMGMTGIETYEVINSVIGKVKPDFLIVVDALAASSITRVNRTIQISDAGINPGSGIGNKRKEISHNSIGVPVIAIGVPTVVDAVSITSSTLEIVLKYINNQVYNNRPKDLLVTAASRKYNPSELEEATEENKKTFLGQIGLLPEHEKKQIIHEALTPTGLNHIVTSKDVDKNIDDLSNVVARGINLSLHRDIN